MRLSILSLLAAATALPEIHISGNKFLNSDNTQFLMRGVAYQQQPGTNSKNEYEDPLANVQACRRDIPYLKELKTNVIRVYQIDPKKDHSECMRLLDEAGIYVIADLPEPRVSINSKWPSWDTDLLSRYTAVVDEMQQYSNLLGFFAGNEVTVESSTTPASAFVKAAIRDTKAHIRNKGYRKIPVGYSGNDDATTRKSVAEFFACGEEADRADFFGLNIYEWCGESTYEQSGYAEVNRIFKDVGIPLFFSEYGCNSVSPRAFQEVESIYTQMTDVWSGGIAFMYFQETNNFGLVTVTENKVTKLKDFDALKSQLEKVKPVFHTELATSTATCPPVDNVWKASSQLPPTPDKQVCSCMEKQLECVVKPDVSPAQYGELFGYLCSQVDCSSIASNATSAIYGAISGCAPSQKLSSLMNAFYVKNGRNPTTCEFQGRAMLQEPSTDCDSGAKDSTNSASKTTESTFEVPDLLPGSSTTGTNMTGSAQTKPGSAQTKPGSAQTKPGSAQTKPGSASTKPGSAQTKPGSAQNMTSFMNTTSPGTSTSMLPGKGGSGSDSTGSGKDTGNSTDSEISDSASGASKDHGLSGGLIGSNIAAEVAAALGDTISRKTSDVHGPVGVNLNVVQKADVWCENLYPTSPDGSARGAGAVAGTKASASTFAGKGDQSGSSGSEAGSGKSGSGSGTKSGIGAASGDGFDFEAKAEGSTKSGLKSGSRFEENDEETFRGSPSGANSRSGGSRSSGTRSGGSRSSGTRSSGTRSSGTKTGSKPGLGRVSNGTEDQILPFSAGTTVSASALYLVVFFGSLCVFA